MKILVSVILIFSLLLAGGLMHFILIKNYINDLNTEAALIQTSIVDENPENFSSALESFDSLWQKKRPVLCILVNHEYIFEIDNTLCEMRDLYEDDFCEYSLSLSNLKSALSCILETSEFSFENIL